MHSLLKNHHLLFYFILECKLSLKKLLALIETEFIPSPNKESIQMLTMYMVMYFHIFFIISH